MAEKPSHRRCPRAARMSVLCSFCAVLLGTLAGCSREPDPGLEGPGSERAAAASASGATGLRLTDVTPESGVEFDYSDGQEAGLLAILETLGGGLAALDYDRDSRPDLFLPGGGRLGRDRTVDGEPSALYRNQGASNFLDVTFGSGVSPAPYYTHGAAVGDYDNDGFPDVLVTGYGGLLLFHNNGDGTFSETAREAGLTDTLWSCSAAWGDVTGDGCPDLYVVHYVDWSFDKDPVCPGAGPDGREICSPNDFAHLPDVLYVSDGDGTFRDASREAGLREDGKGLGVLIADVDVDGRPDIYVANDRAPNFLYRNRGGLPLNEVGVRSGTALDDGGDSNGSMGVDLGDYNLDGWPDIGVSNFEEEGFALYQNQGQSLFQYVSRPAGLAAVGGLYVGWGTNFVDFDLDGDEDLFVANGHVLRYPTKSPLKQHSLLMENIDGERFVNVAAEAGSMLSAPRLGRGSISADFDNDGAPDLALSCLSEPARIFSNQSATDRHWLVLQLVGIRSSRDAVGASVRIRTADGTQLRQVKGGGSFASSSDPRLFFGLGDHSLVEQIEIQWPSGTTQVLPRSPADQMLVITESALSTVWRIGK